ncbi:2'-5' RNA ligase family protein [Sinomonas sp. JGH33]|uniref:2'-5' RNA ligase family protein n=1 Tax=Sinomonas terricola TaxID=3110330 RepID=A0ABU5T2Q0_9MICC|nr:2'-5' RNA ligase family protein [Sinomonas sp. JGH33]MEA5453925.1 2'-5' RNA ligase family protein [Sinomonas sp. JGH33]
MDAHEALRGSASAEPLGAFVVVSFVEPTPVGTRFSKRAWPLHVTLVRVDMPRAAALAACGRAFSALDGAIRVHVAGDADFGYRGRVRVSLIEAEPALQELHERVLAEVQEAVREGRGHVHSPQHTGAGFRPHVSVQGERRVHRGDWLALETVSLVDMAPGGDTSMRDVVAAWGSG